MIALVAAVSGCSGSGNLGGPGTTGPTCLVRTHGQPEELNGTLVLAAQSVPSAAQIPCLRQLPAGWTFHSFGARSGRSSIALDLGREYDNALVVTLTRNCELGQSVRVPSDLRGARRYEDIHRAKQQYTGMQYYLVPGGCIAFRFDVRGVAAEQAASTVARSVGVVDRADLRDYVRRYSRGRFLLDPSPAS